MRRGIQFLLVEVHLPKLQLLTGYAGITNLLNDPCLIDEATVLNVQAMTAAL